MTNKTWDGAANIFDSAADWSPAGIPQPGDVAIINSGTVTVYGNVLQSTALQLNGSASSAPTLNFQDAIIGATSTVTATTTALLGSLPATIGILGPNVNYGNISFKGDASRFDVTVTTDANGGAGILANEGSLDAVGASPNMGSPLTGATGTLQNDGMTSFWNPDSTFSSTRIALTVTGSGVIQVNPHTVVGLAQSVVAGQTVDFTGGAGSASVLQIDHPSLFSGTINGFAQGDTITVNDTPYTSYNYASTGTNTGTLNLVNAGTTVASINFNGVYQTSSFSLSGLGAGQSAVQITTNVAPAQLFNFTNATLGLSGTDAGTAYSGPVTSLQNQYLWAGSDAVAISTSVPNVFIKGGSGADALAVNGGVNVLDGGAGSNFLVGGTGSGSQDTFFVDGRGGAETWSTIVNFHQGDQATIFGFHPNLSTLPYTDQDGTAGFQGVTIHSELNGSGTGINGSITFAGIDRATLDAHFSITTGTLLPGTSGAIDYLLVQYNH